MENSINKDALGQFKDQTKQLESLTKDLSKSLEDLQKKQTEMAGDWKKYAKDFKEGAQSIKETATALKSLNQQVDEHTDALKLANGSLQQNKALLADLKKQYDEVTKTQGDNTKQVAELNVQIGHLSKTITDQEDKLAKSREVFDFHAKSVDQLKTSFDKIKGAAGDFAPALEDAAKGFNFLKDGLSAVKTGFQSVDGALKATGFGLLVLVLQSVVEYLTKTTEGSKILKGGLAVIGQVVETVQNLFGKLGGTIVNAVTHPIESIKAIGNFIKDNIINRFKAFGVIMDAIVNLDFKKLNDGAIQAISGVTNATDKVKNAYQQTKKAITETGDAIVKAYKTGETAAGAKKRADEEAAKKATELKEKQKRDSEERQRSANQAALQNKEKYKDELKDIAEFTKQAEEIRANSIARMAQEALSDYDREINAAGAFYSNQLATYEKFIKDYEDKAKNSDAYRKANIAKYTEAKKVVEDVTKEKNAALDQLTQQFQQNDLDKLKAYEDELLKIARDAGKNAKELALQQIDEKYKAEEDAIDKIDQSSLERQRNYNKFIVAAKGAELEALQEKIAKEAEIQAQAVKSRDALNRQKQEEKNKTGIEFDNDDGKKNINTAEQDGHHSKALQLQLAQLDQQHQLQIAKEKDNQDNLLKINQDYAKKKAAIEDQLTGSRIHAGDKFINAALANSKKDSAIYKAAFLAKKATSIADTIISTKQAVIESFKAYSGIPFIGQALGIAQAAFMAAQGATSIATIVKQKPGFAKGGQFRSDGRGALLSGYSRTDDTNAYLRSGEAVVVSEAMRNPWARNLVSAINVAHGGRDFSATNPGNGYASGGIFTDGGNANRYYSQPANDVKDLANTLAYQMINNFPPIYVDVKDVNSQQNILAQTVNRVNL